jgi:cytochrome c oxidase subunit 4
LIFLSISISMLRLPTSTGLRRSLRAVARPTSSLTLCRAASAHAISNPTLANIEKRWEDMPPQEQADLWMSLRDRMKENWAELTLQEKKAGELASRQLRIWGSLGFLCIESDR